MEGETVDEEYASSCITDLKAEASRQEKHTLLRVQNFRSTHCSASELLLSADGISVLSIHGTSTRANVCGLSLLGGT